MRGWQGGGGKRGVAWEAGHHLGHTSALGKKKLGLYCWKESKFQVCYARSHLCRFPCFKFLKLLVRLFLDTEGLDFDLLSLFLSRILLLLPLLLCCERHRASTRRFSGHSVHQVFTVNSLLLNVRLVRISSPPIDLRISSVIPHSRSTQLTMTPQRSGFDPAPLLKILTGLLLAKLSIPSSLAKYFSTVLPTPTKTGGSQRCLLCLTCVRPGVQV